MAALASFGELGEDSVNPDQATESTDPNIKETIVNIDVFKNSVTKFEYKDKNPTTNFEIYNSNGVQPATTMVMSKSSKAVVSQEPTHCCCSTCADAVRNTFANGYSCGSRMT